MVMMTPITGRRTPLDAPSGVWHDVSHPHDRVGPKMLDVPRQTNALTQDAKDWLPEPFVQSSRSKILDF